MRSSRAARLRSFWIRAFALLVLFCASPGSADMARELVYFATGTECCEDEGCEVAGNCCPGSGVHCSCCSHPKAVSPELELELAAPSVPSRRLGGEAAALRASGYRAPPFRPPAT